MMRRSTTLLFLAAFVLFMFTFIFNTLAEVVRQRLRDVQNFVRQHAEIAAGALEQVLEVAQVRLVAADILCHVNRIPLDFEPCVAAHVTDTIAISHRRHQVVLPQVIQ